MTQPWCELSELAFIGLGYKSLQNRFFYLEDRTIFDHKIEIEFLQPLLRMKDMKPQEFFQSGKNKIQLFTCNLSEADLRGTGALQYIDTMGLLPAVRKRQSGAPQTIKQALTAQGTGYWYAPKAQVHKAHIWLRKGFDSIFSPFLFRKAEPFDQRCNYIVPRGKLNWKAVAAVLSSSLFTLALESYGAASMGAGVLEIPTKKLHNVRVFDIRLLDVRDRKRMVQLAETVWKTEKPTDWRTADSPGLNTQKLDKFILAKLEKTVELNRIYNDISETCLSRLRLAEDKVKTSKRKTKHDIELVATGIADTVRPLLEGRRFPEEFFQDISDSIPFDFSTKKSLTVAFQPMFTNGLVRVQDKNTGNVLFEKDFSRDVAEVFTRALLLGRRKFKLPIYEKDAKLALKEFFNWFAHILRKIEEGCHRTGVDTRYEQELLVKTMAILGLHPDARNKELPREFTV